MLQVVSFSASMGHFRHKRLWQQFTRVCFPNNRRQVLPSKASDFLSAKTKLLSNQVFYPFDPTRNCLWRISVTMIAFYENALTRNCRAKLRVSGDG
jgi:hypothetical protein